MADIVQDCTKKVFPPYVWIPPVYTQHKESMLCQTKGVSICPIHLDAPICLNAPCMLGCPHMFGYPLYVWMAPYASLYVWMPLYGRVPPMFGCPLYAWTPHMFRCSPICLDDVWMPPVHTKHKEMMLCQTKGVSIFPHTFGCPHMFGCLPVCLDNPHVCTSPV